MRTAVVGSNANTKASTSEDRLSLRRTGWLRLQCKLTESVTVATHLNYLPYLHAMIWYKRTLYYSYWFV